MKIAVLIPCYNEAITIGKVVKDFKHELPEADIYVYDNNSKDDTAVIAAANGAKVVREYHQGKGNVVRSMFRNIDADYYIMVDGDDTYPADAAKAMLEPLFNGEADMVIGDRLANGTYASENKRAFHNMGNNLVKMLINKLFCGHINDIMTGYRSFNKFFVKTMPVMSPGFEIETEISIHALDKRFLIKELPIAYRDRPNGSVSKLNTYKDGLHVLNTITTLFKQYKPMPFFSIISVISLILGIAIGIPVIHEFFVYHYIYKVPSAMLAMGFVLIAIMMFLNGLVLDTIVKTNNQRYELYLVNFKNREKEYERNY